MGVRRESVVLTLEDHFSTGMAKAAAQTALLDRELDHLSGSATKSAAATRGSERDVDRLGSTSGKSAKEIDKLSGRLRLLTDASVLLGPALVSAGAVGTAALSGLTSEIGFATVGVGTAILAFQGIGDALKAVNKAALEPTETNLRAAQEAMSGLSTEGRRFVRELQSIEPVLAGLRNAAADGFLPGVADGIASLEDALPRVRRVITAVSTELGDIARNTGESLASDRWAPFLDFLADEAPQALGNLAISAGNVTHALAELWMATTPLNNGFSDWLVKATGDLDRWAAGLSETDGFQEFVEYVENTGPEVIETVGDIANMFLQVAEAAAPLGGPVLQGLQAISKVISAIADSNLGTPIFTALTALTLYNRTLQATAKLQGSAFGKSATQLGSFTFAGASKGGSAGIRGLASDLALARRESVGLTAPLRGLQRPLTEAQAAADRARTSIKGLAKTGALLGGLAVVGGELSGKFNLANTTTLAMAGSIAGPWGAAVGGGIGLLKDFADSLDHSSERAAKYSNSLDLLLAKSGPNLKDQLKAVNAEIDKINSGSQNIHAGEGEGLARVRAKLNPDSTIDKDALEQAKGLRDQLTHEIEKQGIVADQAAASTNHLSAAQVRQAAVTARQNSALIAARDTAKTVGAAWRTLGDDIDNAKVSLDQWIKQQATQARAMNNAADNADTLLERGLRPGKVQELLNAGPQGALRLQELAKGTDAQIRQLNKAQGSFVRGQAAVDEAVARTAAKLQGLTYRPYMLRIDADTSPAQAALAQLRADIARMHLVVKVTASTNATVAEAGTGSDGTTVPKTGLPYADRHLYLLADGERVISNRYGQADRHSSLLDSINSDHRMANGGTAGLPWLLSQRPSSLPSGFTAGGNGPGGLRGYIRDDLDLKFPKTLKQWNAALEASTRLLDKEKAKRQAILDQADSVRSAITSNYRSSLFGQTDTSSIWMSAADRAKAGKGDVFSTLTGDISNLGALKKATAQLKAKGLSGSALAELLSEGSLQDVQGFASGSKADVMKLERLFDARQRDLVSTGNAGAAAAFGASIAAATAQVKATAAQTNAINKIDTRLEKLEKEFKKNKPKTRP